MRDYLIKRLLFTIITVLILSVCIFALVQVPPGDAVDQMVASRGAQGDAMSPEEIAQLKAMYGLDQPLLERYWIWVTGFLRGDMGLSTRGMPVAGMVKEVLPQTIALSLLTLVVTYIIAVPIGIYSATHQYSLGDYLATGFGFIGLATPGFLLGIILLYVSFQFFGISIGGFFSPEFKSAPWSAGQGRRPAPTPMGAGYSDCVGFDGRPNPYAARNLARRAGQAIRDHGAGQGGAVADAAFQVPGTTGP